MSHRPATHRSPLREPAFARVWIAGLVSETGDWLLRIALPVFVLQLTGSPLVTATILVLEVVPILLCGPLAGVLADRWNRCRTIVLGSVVQAVLLLPLLAVTSSDRLWIVYCVTAAESALAALVEPTKNALLPTLVGPDRLVAANSLVGLNSNLARLAGGPVGGILLGVWGLHGVALVDCVSFLLVATLVVGMRARPLTQPRPARRRILEEWAEGIREIRRQRVLQVTAVVFGLMFFAQGFFVLLYVLFVVQELHGGSAAIGLLRGVQGLGGLVGGLLITTVGRRAPAHRLLGWSLLTITALSLLIWNGPMLTTRYPLYVGLFVAVGVASVGSMTGVFSLVQGATPDRLRGRVLSTFLSLSSGLQALGALMAGLIVSAVGLQLLLNLQTVLYLGGGLLALTALAHHAAKGRPVADAEPCAAPVGLGAELLDTDLFDQQKPAIT